MHDTMMGMVEEEQKKVAAAEKRASSIEARFAEMEALLKVKDAELAEAQVRIPPAARHRPLDNEAWTMDEPGI